MQWQRDDTCKIYAWYRWIIAIFFTFSFANSVVFSISRGEFALMFIYLSRWNLFMTMTVTVMGAILVSRSSSSEISNHVLKFYWFLCNNSVCFASVISLIYWTLLHRGESSLNNYLVHASNSLVLIIDLLIVRHPHRMSHFVYPMACGSLYMFFTIVYPFMGGVDRSGANFVYPILDWKNNPQKSTVVGVGCILCLGMTHVVVGLIHRMRNAVHRCVSDENCNKHDQTLPFVTKSSNKNQN